MSLRPFCNISIQQVTSYNFIDENGVLNVISRSRLIEIPFVNEYEIEQGWESHTNNCTIKLPKNIQLKDGNALFKQQGSYNVILGGTTNQNYNSQSITFAPLIMKGDIIYISDGYWYRNQNKKDIQVGQNVFSGYVSYVKSDTPIEISCEDNFYLLKKVPFDQNRWTGDLYSLCKHIIDLTNKSFGLNDKYNITNSNSQSANPYPILSFFEIPNAITADFSLGYLDIGDITCGQLLEKLKQQFHFESTFDGNSLIFGATIYNESTANSKCFFAFHDIFSSDGLLKTSANIFIDHDLEYSNKDDIVLSTIVQCKAINPVSSSSGLPNTTKDGQTSTKKLRLKILVYWDLQTSSFKYVDLSKPNSPVPVNPDGGERHSCWYPVDLTKPAPTLTQLFNLGVQQLTKYFYTGFKGNFDTIGFPYVNWNDNVNLVDSIFSDRNGQYKVKKVKRFFGQEGIKQTITLDYLIQDVESGSLRIKQIPQDTTNVYMI